ncbi:MAG: outer membrane protein assembly factor BamB [Pseudomonadales bacterium]
MIKHIGKFLTVAALGAVLVGCGSSVEEVEPNPLVKFNAERSIKQLWSRDIGSNLGDKYHQLMPSISADAIFATDADGVVSSYTLSDGKLRWKRDLDTQIIGGVGSSSQVSVVTTLNGDAIALDSQNGDVLWQVPVGGEVVSQPQLNNEIVVLQLVSGDIVALEVSSGEQRWVYSAQQPALTLRGNGAPLVAYDATLAGLDSGRFVALDNLSGDVLWQKRVNIPQGKSDIERLTDLDGRPILYQNIIYISGYRGELVALNPFNAEILWRKPYSSYRGLAGGNNSIYLSEAGDIVVAIDVQTASEMWRQDQLLNRKLTSPAVLGKQIVVGDQQGYLHFMSPEDGRFVARYKIGSPVLGDMLVRDNVLYVLSNSGRLSALAFKQ